MSKTGDTKRRILELLDHKSKTLTDISTELDLAPSTVSQHLQEMVDAGMIKQIDDRPRKWKYYEINRGYDMTNRALSMRKIALPIAVIVIALVLVFALYPRGSGNSSTITSITTISGSANTSNPAAQQVYIAPGSSVPQGSTVFTVSDAPTFYNITALNITVTNASIHSETTGKWYSIPLQANTFDLIELRNISTIMSGVKLANGTYDGLVLQISNATAVVNGTKVNVFLPSGRLAIVGDFNITNSTTNWINVDFNLAESLHFTGNGKLIMLPVISVKHANDTDLGLNESAVVVARAPAHIKEMFEFGMDEDGGMMRNFSVPQNVSINESDGKIEAYGIGFLPIIVRGDHDIVIGGDASALLNVSWNRTSSNVTISGGLPLPYKQFRNCTNPVIKTVNVSGGTLVIRKCKGTEIVNTSGIEETSAFPIAANGSQMIDINVQNGTNGNVSAECNIYNGALYCMSNSLLGRGIASANINSYIMHIGMHGNGGGSASGGIGISSGSHNNRSSNTSTNVSSSSNVSANGTEVVGSGKLTIKRGPCLNLTGGQC